MLHFISDYAFVLNDAEALADTVKGRDVDEETRYRLYGDVEDPDVLIVLRPLRRFGAPPIARLKRLLKAAKRSYGFEVVTYRDLKPNRKVG